MITQIQRWRRFFVESAGGCPESEFETDKGWSIAFFSYAPLRAFGLISTFSHIRTGRRDAQIIPLAPRVPEWYEVFALASSTLNFRAESGNRSSARRKSTCRAHRHAIARTNQFGEKLHEGSSCGMKLPFWEG
jgi:hypothetical protein